MKKNKYLIWLGSILLLAGITVGVLGFTNKPSPATTGNQNQPATWVEPEYKWYDVEVDGLACQVGIPLEDIPLEVNQGFFDLSTPICAVLTKKSLKRFIKTQEDYEKSWAAHDKPEEARAHFEKVIKKISGIEHLTWDKIKAYKDSVTRPEWTPVEERVLGIFKVRLPDGQDMCEVKFLNKYHYKNKDSFAICLATLVKRGGDWLYPLKVYRTPPPCGSHIAKQF